MGREIIAEAADENGARDAVRRLIESGIDAWVEWKIMTAALPGVVGITQDVWVVMTDQRDAREARKILR